MASKPLMIPLVADTSRYTARTNPHNLKTITLATRAAAAVDFAAERFPEAVFAVGNAPTALLRLAEKIDEGLRPALVVGVPVGFVNVVESKERILQVCRDKGIPAIVALGRKGGSGIAAAVCNALIYTAAGMLDPKDRGWK